MNEFKQKAIATWSSGDYRSIATFIPPISAHLIRLVNISPDKSILDVACGNGNTAISARKIGAKVTGLDLTPELLDQAVEEESMAEMDGIEWKQGDAEALPFEDESFDIVVSTFGHKFAPHPDLAIKEIVRVTKKGGTIGFATWPPELSRKYVSDNCKIYRYCRSESSSFPNGMGNSRGYPKTSHRSQRDIF